MEKLEQKLRETSEVQEAVRSIYQSIRYDANYEKERIERYTQQVANAADDSELETAKNSLECANMRMEVYNKVFNYLGMLLNGKG